MFADGFDATDKLVADSHGDGDGLFCPIVPLPDAEVGTADAGFKDADQDIVWSWLGLGHILQPETGF